MKILNTIAISTVATIISLSAFANQNSKSEAPCKSSDNTTQSMPMMGGDQNNMPMTKGNQTGMSMMGDNQSGMPMKGQQGGMMHGNQGGMGMMQYMQQRQAMMQTHMVKMETHMANMEASLKELVELQKSK